MLHPDSERRIGDVINLAELLEQKRYHKTANEIRSFVEILKGKKVPEDLLKKMDSLFNLFQKEFEASLPVGQNFRKRCFEEIKSIVFGAIGRMGIIDFNQAILSTYPFLKRINFATKITGAIAEELNGKRITDKNVIFHLRCYAYLLLVEGIFDELARILYFLIKVSKNNVPSSGNLEKMTVWGILKRLGTTPVFLEKWEEKKHIRNSIGHARADYNSVKDEIRFIDIDEKIGVVTYDRIVPLSEFFEMALELEESLDAFHFTFLLLRIYDLIVSKNPYQ